MSETSWALEILKLVPTTILGLIAVYIAREQWRTAHQKVVLDLFDRRMKVYDEITAAIKPVIREGRAKIENVVALQEAQANAKFLFGHEVNDRIEALLDDVYMLL